MTYNTGQETNDRDAGRYSMIRKAYGLLMDESDKRFYNPIKSKLQMTVSRLFDLGCKKASDQLQGLFGKEFIINERTGYNSHIKSRVIEEFIMKYDKKFKKHAQNNGDANNSWILQEGIYFIPLHARDTWLYISTLSRKENLLMYGGVERHNNDMYIYIFGKQSPKFIKELTSVVRGVYAADDLGIYSVDISSSSRYMDDEADRQSISMTYQPLKPRSMSTLFFTNGEIEKLTKHIDNFLRDKEIYDKHQLMYKTGILMWGRPGTGKTSVVRALATKYHRNIISINIPHIGNIDLEKLSEAITMDADREYIVLFEDIDMVFLNRESKDATKSDKDVINKLMQFLDGQTSPNNVIFVATTNHKENISPVIMRKGRLDLHVEIQEIDATGVKAFMKEFEVPDRLFDTIIREYNEWAESEGVSIIGEHARENGIYNQSAVQSIILNHIQHKDNGIVVEDSSMDIAKQYEEEEAARQAEEAKKEN